MAKLMKRYHPPGTPPGTLARRERHRLEPPRIALVNYDEARLDEIKDATPAQCAQYRDRPSTTWVHVSGHAEVEQLRELGKLLGLHALALEDVLNTGQRPKIERFDGQLFVIVSLPVAAGSAIPTEQISLFLTDNLVVSFHEGTSDAFEPVRKRLDDGVGWLRGRKADALLYALLDLVVDHGFPVLEQLGEQIEDLESDILRAADRKSLHALHRVKRDLLTLRRMLWPQREVLNRLLAEGQGLIAESTKLYLRDCYDHTIQIMDLIETYRDMTASMLDIYLSSVSNRLNETMRVLTVIATIFIPPTFFASVYGMNFDRNASPWSMPELGWAYGYPALWSVMLITVLGMLFYFKRRKWF
ncbi:MAG: magnesium/cobalt transporter CorA [Betaproteobacteria bacterium]|nr:magnesium/cobalt transporter CorA [Betaproteobacteria bacterium]MDH3437221.1 magnesium/cobalt transporter CorA [Betaproteobacteria bacterium]